MQTHFNLSDSEFKSQFIRGQLDPEHFSHEAHLRLAWININEYGIEKAIHEFQIQLLEFVTFVGAKDKYNKTLTIAALHIVHHFMKSSKSDDFKGFITEYPQLNHSFKALLASHYGFDIFTSEKAKKEFMEPDLIPFD